MIAPYNCVVMANGRFPQTALPLHLLHQASVVIACDGAVEALDKAASLRQRLSETSTVSHPVFVNSMPTAAIS